MKKKQQCTTNSSAAPLGPLWVLLLVIPFLGGGFYEPVSCFCSIYLIGYLIYCRKKVGELTLYWNLVLVSMMAMAAFYGLSVLWAVDKGMELIGFVKFLPLLLFVLAILQLPMEKREKLLTAVPVSGVVMTLLSCGLGKLPALRLYLTVNERLAGFFQYPNTYALYLLAGVVLLLGDIKSGMGNRMKRVGGLLILIAGIALSGSRTVFFLLATVLLAVAVLGKEKSLRYLVLILLIVLIGVTTVYVLVTGNLSTVGRYLTSSFGSSTLLGRLLYAGDAFPVILQHPFGLGYLGYFYTQGSFQTGVYSVRNVHNELLQLFLDIGWIPAALFAESLARHSFDVLLLLAVRIYPSYTEGWIVLLAQAEDVAEMEPLADKILSHNKSVPLAYSAKARAAYAEGDFGEMIVNKQQAIALSRYELAEYLDYFEMLYVGTQLYTLNGDMESAAYCWECLLEIPVMLEEVLEQTDSLAWQIRDKPELELPEEYLTLLKEWQLPRAK